MSGCQDPGAGALLVPGQQLLRVCSCIDASLQLFSLTCNMLAAREASAEKLMAQADGMERAALLKARNQVGVGVVTGEPQPLPPW